MYCAFRSALLAYVASSAKPGHVGLDPGPPEVIDDPVFRLSYTQVSAHHRLVRLTYLLSLICFGCLYSRYHTRFLSSNVTSWHPFVCVLVSSQYLRSDVSFNCKSDSCVLLTAINSL